MNKIFTFLLLTASFLLQACSYAGLRTGLEEVDYSVLDNFESIQVRRYETRVAAEVRGVKDEKEGFRVLHSYLDGANFGSKEQPAIQGTEAIEGLRIPMTNPYEVLHERNGKLVVRFFLPKSIFRPETAPNPTDRRVTIRIIPGKLLAVLRYPGSNTEGAFRDNAEELLEVLSYSRWEPVGEAAFFGYDSPLAVPAIRTNEVIIEVLPRVGW
jgi:hypothetical protein